MDQANGGSTARSRAYQESALEIAIITKTWIPEDGERLQLNLDAETNSCVKMNALEYGLATEVEWLKFAEALAEHPSSEVK